jgi:hypothetical protein
MTVINAAIQVTQDNQRDVRERTVSERFTEFNHHLFWLTQQKEYQTILNKIDDKKAQRGDKGEVSKEAARRTKSVICRKFDNLLSSEEGGQLSEEENVLVKQMDQLWQSMKEEMDFTSKNYKFALGQKIPAEVKPYSHQDIANKQFVAKHSSILRILTKWAGYL